MARSDPDYGLVFSLPCCHQWPSTLVLPGLSYSSLHSLDPSAFRQISSASNCTDFQSRRLNTRHKSGQSEESKFVHTVRRP